MIRINLLAAERRGAKAAPTGMQAAQKMVVVGSLIMILAVALIGWRFWTLGQQDAQVKRETEAAQAEEARLQAILKQVSEFENRRKMLQGKVALIDELRKGQAAPVVMVDQISRALPEMTWLTTVNQAGYTLTIQGRCLNLTSLSDFIGNLEGSRYFMRPVEIVDTSVLPGDGKTTPDLIEFTIRGSFQMAGIDSVPPTPPGGKGAPVRGGGRG